MSHKDSMKMLSIENRELRRQVADRESRLSNLEAAADAAKQYIEEGVWSFAFVEGMQKVVFCRECRGIREHGHTSECRVNKLLDALVKAREGK